ncbi:MAG TPA: ABC transporter ATP-binding protein [Bacillota bacterium]|nr:ABC transporter ATP-binding protein [Bacillota bacterium]
MSVKLKIEKLAKTFITGQTPLQVLEQVDLAVAPGEFMCILGASGSGKSTLLRLVAGFESADSGSIILDGQPVVTPGSNRMMVFQDFNQLFPWKTVLENVIFPLEVKGNGKNVAKRKDKALHYLRLTRLEGFEAYYPHQLSGGMKQKAAIARALVLEPDLLLMDEPFSSLDPQTRAVLQENLLEIWKSTGVTILFVTHDVQEAVMLADKIAILDPDRHQVSEVVSVDLLRPRNPETPEFSNVKRQVLALLQ